MWERNENQLQQIMVTLRWKMTMLFFSLATIWIYLNDHDIVERSKTWCLQIIKFFFVDVKCGEEKKGMSVSGKKNTIDRFDGILSYESWLTMWMMNYLTFKSFVCTNLIDRKFRHMKYKKKVILICWRFYVWYWKWKRIYWYFALFLWDC